ncbi:Rv1476 family membrane protein [Gordonia rhizosphera]|uniref:Uncharacterized protein n=1 Tax=Gordonia rhizosphera NBRC 16068 TaxID=1108045 RepID=K6WIB2_9ACTN|nr:DUF6676 family protein [Gordonia rhizosphera]GAB93526.1 hypothetical protein GORHZ_227_00150 [Gordonia rhizosphera NBRC 16068]
MSPGATTQDLLALPSSAAPSTASGPGGVDMTALLDDVRDDHVAAPAEDVPGLREVVADAQADGYDVSFVVIPRALPKFTQYRDIATELQGEVGGTVIVLGPNSMGSASPDFSRFQQEKATENVRLANPPQAARQLWDQMTAPALNWTVISIVLILVVVAGAVVARLGSRRRAARGGEPGADDASTTAAGPGTHDLSRDLP